MSNYDSGDIGQIMTDMEYIKKTTDRIDEKMDKLADETRRAEVRLTALETKHGNVVIRIAKLEKAQSNIIWLIIAAIVGAILKLILIDGGIPK